MMKKQQLQQLQQQQQQLQQQHQKPFFFGFRVTTMTSTEENGTCPKVY